MNARTGISIVLIAFIIVSIIYLVVTETGSNELAQTNSEEVQAHDDKSCADCEESSTCSEGHEANIATKDVAVSGIENEVSSDRSDEHGANGSPEATTKNVESKVMAYYFHGEVRCTTCNTIEAYARENLKNNFAAAMKSGSIEFREINIDEDKNAHFIEEFELSSSSLVLAKIENGKRTMWKNLEKVWTLVHDKPEFLKYTREETSKYLDTNI